MSQSHPETIPPTNSSSSQSSSSSRDSSLPHIVIVPGNGCGRIERANWYCWVANQLRAKGFQVDCQAMPDPNEAKESIWIPFIRDKLKADQNTILIGHSSGAEAGMRYLETDRILGLVLVSACHTDLGMESERISGYYSRPWEWDKIRSNAEWIVQYHSIDDPFIPIEEARHVAKNLKSEFIEDTKKGHYMSQTFQELVDLIEAKTNYRKTHAPMGI